MEPSGTVQDKINAIDHEMANIKAEMSRANDSRRCQLQKMYKTYEQRKSKLVNKKFKKSNEESEDTKPNRREEQEEIERRR